jgi:deoxyribodipyrimidine photolyase-related protein
VGIKFHQQKVVLHRASMKQYAATLGKRGYQVHYRDFAKGKTIRDHLKALRRQGFQSYYYCDPVDFLLEKRLRRCAGEFSFKLEIVDTPMFLSPKSWLEEQFDGKKRPFMAKFYERQRQRLNILVEADGSPQGGKWSFDQENRKSMPRKGLEVPPDPIVRSSEYTKEAIGYTKCKFKDYYGDADNFAYPVSHVAAERWLDRFLEQRFALFGDYEDAISQHERVLFHGVLTPMMNIGLLTPQQVLDRALDFAKANHTPMNCVEGFVRQIIGWREFIRGAYDHLGVACRTGNFWGFESEPIPQAFYDGTTGIDPVDCVIRRVLDHGWCHHIERLMILGNFMLLCGFHPDRVYDWFMELFVDAYDWVMVPNVYGMSQFADGGLFTTKPYISGSNYVRKMSDFSKGPWCEVWDGLFWMFIKQHEAFFRKQHRLGMMTRQLDKMGAGKLEDHRRNADNFLKSLTA